MKKPTVYLDTNIVSALCYDGGDVAALARRLATREWWAAERRYFVVFASSFTEIELGTDRYAEQDECSRFVRRLKYLPVTKAVRELASEFIARGVIPREKPRDAAHLAVAAAHDADYVLTWNYAHLANPVTQAKTEQLLRQRGLSAPWLVSPESIPQVRLGRQIRRR
jgi:predicted nucleic acid-binding protein